MKIGLGLKRLLIVLSAAYWLAAVGLVATLDIAPGFQKAAMLEDLFRDQGPPLTASEFAQTTPIQDDTAAPPSGARWRPETPIRDGFLSAARGLALAGVLYAFALAIFGSSVWVSRGFRQSAA